MFVTGRRWQNHSFKTTGREKPNTIQIRLSTVIIVMIILLLQSQSISFWSWWTDVTALHSHQLTLHQITLCLSSEQVSPLSRLPIILIESCHLFSLIRPPERAAWCATRPTVRTHSIDCFASKCRSATRESLAVPNVNLEIEWKPGIVCKSANACPGTSCSPAYVW